MMSQPFFVSKTHQNIMKKSEKNIIGGIQVRHELFGSIVIEISLCIFKRRANARMRSSLVYLRNVSSVKMKRERAGLYRLCHSEYTIDNCSIVAGNYL